MNPANLIPHRVVELVAAADWITVFTGAGMSADSGVPTFRDTRGGLWENVDPTALATPAAFAADPGLVWGWYRWRAAMVANAAPNAGHHALAQLASGTGDSGITAAPQRSVMVVTQNVDDLHERAGSTVTSHLHGSLFEPRCAGCGAVYDVARFRESLADLTPGRVAEIEADIAAAPSRAPDLLRTPTPRCDACGRRVRPGIVWFGEALPQTAWQRAESCFRAAEVVIVVGTSGVVHPAAGLPEHAARAGIPVVEINPEPSAVSAIATARIAATAAVALPELLAALPG